MKNQAQTPQPPMEELDALRRRIGELEKAEAACQEEKALWQEKRLYSDLVNTLPAGVYRLRVRLCGDWQAETWASIVQSMYSVDMVSDRYCSVLGIAREEATDAAIVRSVIHPDDIASFDAANTRAITGLIPFAWEGRIIRDQQTRWVRFESLPRVLDPATVLWTGIVYDITDRHLAQEKLQENEERMRYIIKHDPNAIAVYDRDLNYIAVSDRYLQDYGVVEADIIGRHHYDVFPEMPQRWKEVHRRCLNGAIERSDEDCFERPDGSVTYNRWECRPWYRATGEIGGMITYTEVTTERIKAQMALQESEKRLRDLIFSIADWVWEVDEDGVYTYSSQKGLDLLGESPEAIVGKRPFDFMPPDEAKRVAAIFFAMAAKKAPIVDLENWNIKKGGELICLLTNGVPILDGAGNLRGYRGVDKDITERKRVEQELGKSHHLLANLTRQVPGVVYQYRLYPDGRSAFPYSSPGMNDIYEVTPEDVREDATPVFGRLHPEDYDDVVEAIQESARTLRTFYCEFRVILPRQGLRWRWSQAHPERLADGSILWHGIISDISERKQIEEQLRLTMENLRKAVGTTIQVMVAAVEARDPYTAGHQTRSADLASAIARELGLPQETIDGIGMAGSIHDIGKLSIPVELLSKPTKLSEIEYSLIKEHSQIGYDILKDVKSPWPLAEIVYQHHERMDGSGYPRNLKGDQILIEARILAVADVVESIASYRPYRPALGIGAALAEILKNRGLLYDDHAVMACQRLFVEKGYRLLEA